MSVRELVDDLNAEYFDVYVKPRASSLTSVLATAVSTRVAFDASRFIVKEEEGGLVFTVSDGDMGYFFLGTRPYPATSLRVRYPSPRELQETQRVRRTNVIVEVSNGTTRGPELRDVSGELTVFLISGKQVDALAAARNGDPVDVKLLAAVEAAVALFRARKLPVSPLVVREPPTGLPPRSHVAV
jgi:hypothetical protein